MKIAVFHNFMDNIGGAEIVSLTLARELNADVYTTNIDAERISQMGFFDVIPRIKSIGKVPLRAPFRHQMSFWRFRRLNLKNKYDLYIIAGDWAMSGAVNNKPNLWYVHSPLNELWQFRKFIRQNVLTFWQRPLFDIWTIVNRILTLKYFKHVDSVVANSKNTANRLKKFYKTDSIVITPPVDTKKFEFKESEGYWLSVNRLFANKRVDIQLEAFSKLPDEKLIIVGCYEKGSPHFETYQNQMNKLKAANIEVIHWVDEKRLIDLYSHCKGFITTAKDEDFGLTAVEAMASGKPVIAPNEGGYMETVVDKKTGLLIDELDGGKLKDAIMQINSILLKDPHSFKEVCIKQAELFSSKGFFDRINKIINNTKI